MINEDNIELWLFQYKEGLLDGEERATVERALEERPDWQELADLYDPELRVPALDGVVYEGKEGLKRHKPVSKIRLWGGISAAACISLLLLAGIRMITKFETENYNGQTLAFVPNGEQGTEKDELKQRIANPPQRKMESVTTPTAARHSHPKGDSAAAGQRTESEELQNSKFIIHNSQNEDEVLIAYLDTNSAGSLPVDATGDVAVAEDFITYLDEDTMPQSENTTGSPLLSAARDRLNSIRLAYVEWQTAEIKQRYEKLNNN